MPRGTKSEIGAEEYQNGYLYVKVSESRWIAKHRLIVEERLGRELTRVEYIRFKDNNRNNLDPDNLVVCLVNNSSLLKRIEKVKSKIAELQQELADLESFI